MGEEVYARRAVDAAAEGARAWRQALLAQHSAAPDHHEFYELAAELVDTVRCVETVVRVLRRQVAGYGQGRRLRDDAGADPLLRLARAVELLESTADALGRADTFAADYWSAIGHLAVEEEPS